MKVICNYCDSPTRKETFVFRSSRVDPRTGQAIVIQDAPHFQCTNQQCGHAWMSEEHEDYIEAAVSKRARYRLTPEEIGVIRKGLPFHTKRELADFLGLNSKAFSKWENGYTEINDAYDLLLRLAARSNENLDFIKYLHEHSFQFKVEDYQALHSGHVPGSYKIHFRALTDRIVVTEPKFGGGYVQSSPAKKGINKSYAEAA